MSDTFAKHWSQGRMLGSLSTWSRIARTLPRGNRPVVRSKRARRAPVKAPVVFASAANQAWCWDITLLPGPYVGQHFHAYSVMDLYSRKIVGFAVHDSEQDVLARDVFLEAITTAGGVIPDVVHSDSGSAMRSNLLTGFLTGLGVRMSFNRPRVSNDNAFKESEFRTMKYRPGAPAVFTDLEHAREFVTAHVNWYNREHYHRGIGYFTPDEVYSGAWKRSHQAREKTLRSYAKTHPSRFRGGVPVVVRQPGWAGINTPCPELARH
ncbi:DDE-type integrase/transposase/recombinase [Falsarthrobacter nasiphocae]|uniref:Transposase InsO family protein n=1 Tax=Falsarthrobacter nasiphocae TaxID=189863 RepID=A0AAE3YHC8_9MICC|nr:DDE-type integrase/transposase/recombinase [Falsarthrobacter nasiphocae]MDR6891520.1 transposase InsO family protein [Falsarthrobacter nasiphocae]MDR6891614.1 transposase InsO family protein [Falsarthrobacter nasiphocae]MDR6892211.1 transposase InsO family protein [Falsarthrobacter nasiphocae]MDR6892220.1 transposase InsO family protein [Falsarthrobacter nasiphocae]